MANEAVIIELLGDRGDVINFTIADATDVPKGSIMELTDERTCILMSAVNKPIAGIAASEKTSGDGTTTIGLYTYGIFDLSTVAGGSMVLGADVVSSGAGNEFDNFDTLDREKGYVIGKSLATGAASTVNAVLVRVF